jgi:hypothetical protein
MRWLIPVTLVALAVAGGLLLTDPGVCPARAEEGQHPSFGGADSCKTCHLKQVRSWAKNAKAKAFTVLQPGQAAEAKTAAGLDPNADFTRDATCLKCHVTGFGQPGGYPSVDHEWTEAEAAAAKALQAVGCEACHGPGSLYIPHKKDHEDFKRADIAALGATIPVTTEICLRCHVNECPTMGPDYAFDAAAELEKQRTSDLIHVHTPLKHGH